MGYKDYQRKLADQVVSGVRGSAARAPTATHRHKKRGTEYVLIGYGKMQAENWRVVQETGEKDGYGFPVGNLLIADMREVAIYRDAEDGSLWVRPREEWEDGRFEVIADD